ncbi:MAG: DUF4426 domain-containing protein [Halioglobus sp.]
MISLLWLALLGCPAFAQQAETFGPYELHYSVVNTSFLDPKIAETYGIVRGEKRALVNLAVRENIPGGSVARTMALQARSWDLIQNQTLEFREIREGESIYYIAEFPFINEEWRFFEIQFRPAGADQTYNLTFKRQLYVD